jgi:hypothetical protein
LGQKEIESPNDEKLLVNSMTYSAMERGGPGKRRSSKERSGVRNRLQFGLFESSFNSDDGLKVVTFDESSSSLIDQEEMDAIIAGVPDDTDWSFDAMNRGLQDLEWDDFNIPTLLAESAAQENISSENSQAEDPKPIYSSQRQNPSALDEALYSAREEIRLLRAERNWLEESLADSNKTNRALKNERLNLEDENEDIRDELNLEREIGTTRRSNLANIYAGHKAAINPFTPMKASTEYSNEDNSDSETSVTSPSYPSSIFSLESYSSSASSVISSQLVSAIEEITLLLCGDDILIPLYQTCFTSKDIGKQRFEDNFRRLLKIYARDLEAEVSDPLEVKAAAFMRSRARRIAFNITRNFDQEGRVRRLSLSHLDDDQ